MTSRFWGSGGTAAFALAHGFTVTGVSLAAGTIAFDTANGWTTGENPPAIAITMPSDGSVQIGDWFRNIYGTSSSLAGATNAPWHQITSGDVLNDTLGLTYAWGVTLLPAGTQYIATQFGRGADSSHITTTSAISNIINDTYISQPSFTPATTQPAAINNGYGSAVYNFTGMNFLAGFPTVYIAKTDGSHSISSVILVGAGAAGADLTGTIEAGTSGVLVTFPAPAAPGTYTVKVTLSGAAGWLGCMGGTIVNATGQHPTATEEVAQVSASSWTAPSALTVTSTSVGAAFLLYDGSGAITETDGAGTIVVNTGLNGMDGITNNTGFIGRDLTAGSWTPAFSAGTGAIGHLIAAVWS